MTRSLDTNNAPLASPSSVATLRNGEARPRCVVCQKEILANHWLCPLPQNGNGESAESLSIQLCSARCALHRFASLRPRGNGFDEYEHQERTIPLLIDGGKPAWL